MSGKKICTLFIGRPLAVDKAEDALADSDVFHLLPYRINDTLFNDLADEEQKALVGVDQRSEWWQRFATAKSLSESDLPESLVRGSIDQLTREPLICYLVAINYLRKPETFTQEGLAKRIFTTTWSPPSSIAFMR